MTKSPIFFFLHYFSSTSYFLTSFVFARKMGKGVSQVLLDKDGSEPVDQTNRCAYGPKSPGCGRARRVRP